MNKKLLKHHQKNYQKTFLGWQKKKKFSNQIKNKYKLISIKIKKNIFFLGLKQITKKSIKNTWKKSSKIFEKSIKIYLKNKSKNLKFIQKYFSIKIKKKKKSQKLAKKRQKNSKIPSRSGKKNFFSNQIKNKYKLSFNQNKKKNFFFGTFFF